MSDKLRKVRLAKGHSLRAAERAISRPGASITHGQLQNLELGDNPRVSNALRVYPKVAEYYGVTREELAKLVSINVPEKEDSE